jgi:hypothetical protein
VVPPLQPGVVGSYPVWGTWFLSRLLRERTRSCPDFFYYNRRSVVPGVQDPDTHHAMDAVRGEAGNQTQLDRAVS